MAQMYCERPDKKIIQDQKAEIASLGEQLHKIKVLKANSEKESEDSAEELESAQRELEKMKQMLGEKSLKLDQMIEKLKKDPPFGAYQQRQAMEMYDQLEEQFEEEQEKTKKLQSKLEDLQRAYKEDCAELLERAQTAESKLRSPTNGQGAAGLRSQAVDAGAGRGADGGAAMPPKKGPLWPQPPRPPSPTSLSMSPRDSDARSVCDAEDVAARLDLFDMAPPMEAPSDPNRHKPTKEQRKQPRQPPPRQPTPGSPS